MTFQRQINTQAKTRGLPPMSCASCGVNTFDRDEMAVKSDFIEGHVDDLEAYFGGKVCDTCANDIELPNADDDCDHERLERHGWEQV